MAKDLNAIALAMARVAKEMAAVIEQYIAADVRHGATQPDRLELFEGRTDCERDILTILREAGRRLTTGAILAELESREMIHGESTVKQSLARLVRDQVLDNRTNADPRGYGFP